MATWARCVAAMAKLDHDVLGVDDDDANVAALAAGRALFYEPGLTGLLAETLATGRLRRVARSRGRRRSHGPRRSRFSCARGDTNALDVDVASLSRFAGPTIRL